MERDELITEVRRSRRGDRSYIKGGTVGDEHKSELCREEHGLKRTFRGHYQSINQSSLIITHEPVNLLHRCSCFILLDYHEYLTTVRRVCSALGSSMLILFVDLFTD